MPRPRRGNWSTAGVRSTGHGRGRDCTDSHTSAPLTCPLPAVRTFSTGFKGAPPARRADGQGRTPGAGWRFPPEAGRRSSRVQTVTVSRVPPLRCGGFRRSFGRQPTSRRAAARRCPRTAPHGPPAAAPGDHACKNERPSSSRRASCRRAKITVKGAFGVAFAMAQAPPLTVIFLGKSRRLSGGRGKSRGGSVPVVIYHGAPMTLTVHAHLELIARKRVSGVAVAVPGTIAAGAEFVDARLVEIRSAILGDDQVSPAAEC